MQSSAASCVTIVGEPGVGKSRLVAEALAEIDARIVRGRCLPYGDGITYWPVVEVIKQLDALPSDPAAAAAIRSLLGETEQDASAEEIAWAFRKLLEEQAPLVVVFDDIQWGEETFLDLVEGVALLSSAAPILLVCMARPELARAARRVAGRSPARAACRTRRSNELIGDVPAELRERIAPRAGGNPLFLTEMLAMAEGDRRGRGPADAARAARGPPRPARPARSARCSSAARSRARSSTAAPSRRSPTDDAGDAAAGGARPQGADPPRPRPAARARTASASATC